MKKEIFYETNGKIKVSIIGEYDAETQTFYLKKGSKLNPRFPKFMQKNSRKIKEKIIMPKTKNNVLIEDVEVKASPTAMIEIFSGQDRISGQVIKYKKEQIPITADSKYSQKDYRENNELQWDGIYNSIGKKILEYRENQKALIEILNNSLRAIGGAEYNANSESLDPFTFFNFINKTRKENARKNLLKKIVQELKINKNINICPNGIPLYSTPSITTIWTDNFNAKEINNKFWDLFEKGLNYTESDNEEFIELYDFAIKNIQKRAPKSCFSNTLFCVNSKNFIPLDTNTISLINQELNENFKDASAIDGRSYLKLIQDLKLTINNTHKYKDFKEISYTAKKDDNDSSENYSNNISDEYNLSNYELNQILYGAPGCGKSYKIEQIIEKNKLKTNQYIRILFHPDYSYSDFVGQIQPSVDNKGNVTYKFNPGPFTKILKRALNSYLDGKNDKYLLVIDEINRGNAPAIFGDIFQLLDRDKSGNSTYKITNDAITNYLCDEKDDTEKAIKKEKVKEIFIPKNLSIFATMNTSDQNVFTLDTAFKRRWYFEKISNEFDKNNVDDVAQMNTDIDGLGITWGEFQKAINEVIADKLSDYGIDGEDKQLGKYFVKENDLKKIKRFAEKVLLYIWEDVVKIDREILFDSKYKTLDKLIEAFIGEEKLNIFNEDVRNRINGGIGE